VLAGLTADQIAGMVLPVGHLTKDEVRAEAAARGLRTAVKAESQDLCFVASGGRRAFLADRAPLTPGRVVDTDGRAVGHVAGVELVTVGQRKGLGLAAGAPRYVLDVDAATGQVIVGSLDDLLVDTQPLEDVVGPVPGARVWAQVSAHGHPRAGTVEADAVRWDEPQPRVAPGQLVAFYAFDAPDLVVGAATAAR
jgi:tRNA-specific 2-thiouridylase